MVIGVDEQDLTGDARKFVARYHVTYAVLRDTSGAVSGRWGVTDYPESFIIDRQGRVLYHFAGSVSGHEIDAAMRKLKVA